MTIGFSVHSGSHKLGPTPGIFVWFSLRHVIANLGSPPQVTGLLSFVTYQPLHLRSIRFAILSLPFGQGYLICSGLMSLNTLTLKRLARCWTVCNGIAVIFNIFLLEYFPLQE